MRYIQLVEKQINKNNIINDKTCEYLYTRNRTSKYMADHFRYIDKIVSSIYDRSQYEIQLWIDGYISSVFNRKEWYNNTRLLSDHNQLSLRLVIHFPTIIIENSKKQKVPLKDIYVVFSFDTSEKELKLTSTMNGFRTTFSNAEWQCSYAHSHLSGIQCTQIDKKLYLCPSSFCLGTTEFWYLQQDMRYSIKDSAFKFVLMFLKEYLSWESLEGKPYKKLSEVFEKIEPLNEKLDLGIILPKINYLYSIIINRTSNIQFEFSLEENKFKIVENENYDSLLRRHFGNYICYRDEKGNYYPYGNFQEPVYFPMDSTLTFHGKELSLLIEKTNHTNEEALVILPILKSFVTTTLNSMINNVMLKRYVKKGTTRITSN